MAKKKNKKEIVFSLSGYENTIIPKFNPYQTGHGVHQSKKYPNRSQRKNDIRKLTMEY